MISLAVSGNTEVSLFLLHFAPADLILFAINATICFTLSIVMQFYGIAVREEAAAA